MNETEKRLRCRYLFRDYIGIVINKIDDYNNHVLDEHNNELNRNLTRFTEYLLKHNYAVKYYTTNYDNIVPQILGRHFDIYEGFINSSTSYKRFNYDLARFRKACLTHFNLHGSIFLHKMRMDVPEIKDETVYDLSGKNEYRDFIYEDSGNVGELLPFSPIITGYNKTQRISNRPFDLGFHAFANDCNDCQALLTVGFSFSDPHINSIISNSIKWDKTSFVDINPCSMFQKKEVLLSQFIPKHEKEDSDWIHDLSGKKHIFKEGFDAFLSDKGNWKYLINK
jgi:hypothetical protein